MDNGLSLLGIARKAGRLEVGEEPVGAACRAKTARLVLLAADSADNTVRRATHFSEAGKVPWLKTPYTKAQLGLALGRATCAMLAVTDPGLAASLAERLAQADPEGCGETAQSLREQAERFQARQDERRRHEKNLRRGGKKPWAPPAGKK